MYVLGIDAGGTKTVCYFADGEGRIIGEGRGSGANLQAHGELEVEKVLHGVIETAVGNRSIVPTAVCIGIAGVDREDDDTIVRGIMRRLGFRSNALVVNDALIALVAGTGDDPGVVLISGTGSIAYGVNQNGFAARSGGWGYVLGDEGSGYWIGQRALSAVVRSTDGRGSSTRLTALVLEHLQLAKVEGLVKEVYDRGLKRQSVAALGPVVERARAEGDLVAAEIMNAAVDELVRAAASVIERLQMRGLAFRIVLAGSMFRLVPWLTSAVVARLVEVAPRATAARLETEPAVGALRLALRAAHGEVRIPPYLETTTPTTA